MISCVSNGFRIHSVLFLTASEKLKKAEFLLAIKFGDNFFKHLAINYRNLTELTVNCRNSNYSSNDIFWILRLKKLKFLQFMFPEKSQLDPGIFSSTEDLSLPVIEDVNFALNDSISLDHISNFLQFIRNVSKFCFNSSNFCYTFLDHISKKLPNLIDLQISGKINSKFIPDSTTLLKIQSNIEKYNRNPLHLFRLNGHDIDYWMEEVENSPVIR